MIIQACQQSPRGELVLKQSVAFYDYREEENIFAVLPLLNVNCDDTFRLFSSMQIGRPPGH